MVQPRRRDTPWLWMWPWLFKLGVRPGQGDRAGPWLGCLVRKGPGRAALSSPGSASHLHLPDLLLQLRAHGLQLLLPLLPAGLTFRGKPG